MIRFTVSYANSTGELVTRHETTRSALEEAREYIRKGYHDVSLTDLQSGGKTNATGIKKSLDRIDGFYSNA